MNRKWLLAALISATKSYSRKREIPKDGKMILDITKLIRWVNSYHLEKRILQAASPEIDSKNFTVCRASPKSSIRQACRWLSKWLPLSLLSYLA
jgi:hypothetical protein